MQHTCPECGASLAGDTTCQTIFDSFLALEFSDPGFGEVHMFTVACFMIQHGRYSDEGLKWIEGRLRAYLVEGVTTEEIRRQARRETDQEVRSWRVTRRTGAPPQPRIDWSMTIADVAAGYRDAASYRELVRRWARATLDEMEELIGRR